MQDPILINPLIATVEHSLVTIPDYLYIYQIKKQSTDIGDPLTSDSTLVIFCTKGMATGKIDMHHIKIEKGKLFVTLPNQTVMFDSGSNNFECICAILTKRFMDNIFLPDFKPSIFSFINPVIEKKLSPDEINAIRKFINTLKEIIYLNHPNLLQIARNLAVAVFYHLVHNLNPIVDAESKNITQRISQSFFYNLQQYYKYERSVNFYAKKVGVSSKYLSLVIRRITHHSAKEWIDSFVISDAKIMIKSSDKSIQQIAFDLRFPNQSFFGKFFKRNVGMSPKEYRDS